MQLRTFFLGMVLVTLIGLTSFFGLLFYFDPYQISKLILILVYLTLFFGLTGFLTLTIFLLRKLLKSKNPTFKDVENSFWQAALLSLILIGVLIITSNF